MPSVFAHGGGILMLVMLGVGSSALGWDSSSAELPRITQGIGLSFDASRAATVTSSHGGRQRNGNGTVSSRHTRAKSECPSNAIGIFQGRSGYYSGIPRYSVEITNNCLSCGPWDIHLHCGSFASTKLVNPSTFRRTAVDDCLRSAGSALPPGHTVASDYTNSFMYPLEFKSAKYCM